MDLETGGEGGMMGGLGGAEIAGVRAENWCGPAVVRANKAYGHNSAGVWAARRWCGLAWSSTTNHGNCTWKVILRWRIAG